MQLKQSVLITRCKPIVAVAVDKGCSTHINKLKLSNFSNPIHLAELRTKYLLYKYIMYSAISTALCYTTICLAVMSTLVSNTKCVTFGIVQNSIISFQHPMRTVKDYIAIMSKKMSQSTAYIERVP